MFARTARCLGETISDQCVETETRVECALLGGGTTLTSLLLSHGIFSCSTPTNALLTTVKVCTVALNTSLGERVGNLVNRMASGLPQGRGERQRILEKDETVTPPLATGPTPG